MLAIIFIVVLLLVLSKYKAKSQDCFTVWYTTDIGSGVAKSYDSWHQLTTVMVDGKKYKVQGQIPFGTTVDVERAVTYIGSSYYRCK